jgi:hypothetical protein
MVASSLTKIMIRVEPEHWHSARSETLWATPLAPSTYRLENAPLYAKGFSFLDVVIAERVDGEVQLVVRSVLRKSGHSTYAVFVEQGVAGNAKFAAFWQPLDELGCRYEGLRSRFLAVDVPAATDIHTAFRLLMIGQENGVWLVQEQDVGHELGR